MIEKEGKLMLVEERHQKIIKSINEEISVRVADLSRRFLVTEETIRQDF